MSVEALQMPSVDGTPPSLFLEHEMPDPGSDGIRVTTEIFTEIRFDVNELAQIAVDDSQWERCLVPSDQICPEFSDWNCIKGTPGITVTHETYDCKCLVIAVTKSYIPWLTKHKFKFEIDHYHDRTKPKESEENVYGRLPARWRSQTRFLQIAAEEIWSKASPGLDSFFRSGASLEVRIPLEWIILNHDVLEAPAHVRTKFAQSLVFLSLNLLEKGSYDSFPVLALLGKSEERLLDTFRADHTDLFKPGSRFPDWNAEFHKISLVRHLLVICGGKENTHQRQFDETFTAHDSLSVYGSLVDLGGSNTFGNFEPHAMLEQFSKAKVFTKEDLRSLNVQEWTAQLRDELPIGFPPGQLDLPSKLVHRLYFYQMKNIFFYIEQVYYRRPSLKQSKNDIIVLLIWSTTIHGHCPRILSEWAVSKHGREVYKRMFEDIQNSQSIEQLALTLTALLCYWRLLPFSSNDVLRSVSGCYLEDFDALIDGHHLGNERMVLERMLGSFQQAARSNGDDLCEFLPSILTTDCRALECPELYVDKYWVYRLKDRLTHSESLKRAEHQDLMKTRTRRSILKDGRTDLGQKSMLRWYEWGIFAPNIMAVITIYSNFIWDFVASWVWKIQIFSIIGESCLLMIEFIHVCHHSSPFSDRRAVLIHLIMCLLRSIITCTLLLISPTASISDDLAMSILIFDLLSIFAAIQVRVWVADRPTIPGMMQPLLPASSNGHGKKQNIQTSKHSKEQCLPLVDNLKKEHPDLGPSAFAKVQRGWNMDQYTFIRLSNLQSSDPAQKISAIRNHKAVFSLVELPDESWEVVALISDIPVLKNKISQMFPSCNIDTEYDPIKPNSGDVERLCIEAGSSSFLTPSESANPFYFKARDLKMRLFRQTIRTLSTTHPKIAIFYTCWYERNWQSEYGMYV